MKCYDLLLKGGQTMVKTRTFLIKKYDGFVYIRANNQSYTNFKKRMTENRNFLKKGWMNYCLWGWFKHRVQSFLKIDSLEPSKFLKIFFKFFTKNTVDTIILNGYFCQLNIFVFFVFGSFLGQSESSPEVS